MAHPFFKLMTKITAWLDRRLAKYRPPKKKPVPYRPASKEELIALLKRCSSVVLSDDERTLIAGAMAFPVLPVRKIMHPKDDLTFLHEKDSLKPLLLDELYKTRQNCFPVLDKKQQISGVFHLDGINALEAVDDRVSAHLSSAFCFVRVDYSLEMLLNAFLRTNSGFAFVVDRSAKLVGFATISDLLAILLTSQTAETFSADRDLSAVAERSKI